MFPNDARYLYDWTHTSKLSYGDFLRARQFERSVRFAIDDQARRLVATNTDLAERGFNIVAEFGEKIESGVSLLSCDIRDLRDSMTGRLDEMSGRISEVTYTLRWGFGAVLDSLSEMNATLSGLLKAVHAPSVTWAYEQFHQARDEFRRGLYPEALASASRAIEGYGANAGYRTEFRFHFFVGVLRLGDHKNSLPNVVNPKAAEEAFLAAARYADVDHPKEAGRALICAGRAAEVQSQIDASIVHTRAGLIRLPESADGHYQLARVLCLKGKRKEAEQELLTAITLDDTQALRATSEAVFLSAGGLLPRILEAARARYEAHFRNCTRIWECAMNDVLAFSYSGVTASSLLTSELSGLSAVVAKAKTNAEPDTIFAYSANTRFLMKEANAFSSLFKLYVERFAQLKRAKSQQLSTEDSAMNAGVQPARPDFFLAQAIGVVGFLASCTYQAVHPDTFVDMNSQLSPFVILMVQSFLSAAAIAGAVYMTQMLGFGARSGQWNSMMQNKARMASQRSAIDRELSVLYQMVAPSGWIPTVRLIETEVAGQIGTGR